MNNHFLVVYSEFKNLYREDPYAEFQGGRLWATYVDPYGQLGQPYKPGEAAFPLTDVFIDKQTGMYLDHVVYDPIHNEYLVIFTLVDYQDMYNPSAHIWGTIIKQN
jgi:hypothetical protein